MSDMVGVRLDEKYIRFLDQGIKDGTWPNRSEGIRYCIGLTSASMRMAQERPKEASEDSPHGFRLLDRLKRSR